MGVLEGKAIKIGKYDVEPHAEGTHQGGFEGYAVITWNEGNKTCQTKLTFTEVFPTLGEAIEHATTRANTLTVESLDQRYAGGC